MSSLSSWCQWRHYFFDLPLFALGLRLQRLEEWDRLSGDREPLLAGVEFLRRRLGADFSSLPGEEIARRANLVKLVRESDTYASLLINRRRLSRWFSFEGLPALCQAIQGERPVIFLGGHLGRTDVQCVPVVNDEEFAGLLKKLPTLFKKVQAMWGDRKKEIRTILGENKRLSRNNSTAYGSKRLERAIKAMDEFTAAESMPWLLPDLLTLFTGTTISGSLLKNRNEPPTHRFFDYFDDFYARHQSDNREISPKKDHDS